MLGASGGIEPSTPNPGWGGLAHSLIVGVLPWRHSLIVGVAPWLAPFSCRIPWGTDKEKGNSLAITGL